MEHLINLNFAPGGLPATVHVSQYDDTIRQLRFQLWFGRSKVEVPPGASVRVDIKKPDGHIVLVTGTVDSSDRSIVTVPTTKQMTAAPGGARGTLVVSSTGDKRISSAIFILQVHRDPVEDGDASDSDLSMLQDAIDQTAANASAAQAAAKAAQEAASSFTTDTTLSVSGKAADAKKTGDELTAIKADLANIETLSPELKDILLRCFEKVLWEGDAGASLYSELSMILTGQVIYKLGVNMSIRPGSYSIDYNNEAVLFASFSANDISKRRIFYVDDGIKPLNDGDGNVTDIYPISVPKNVTWAKAEITPAERQLAIYPVAYDAQTQKYIEHVASAGYLTGAGYSAIPGNDKDLYLAVFTRYNASNAVYASEPSEVKITFGTRYVLGENMISVNGGGGPSNGKIQLNMNLATKRRTFYSLSGRKTSYDANGNTISNRYPIPLPLNVKTIKAKIEPASMYIALYILSYNESTKEYSEYVPTAGYKEGQTEYEITGEHGELYALPVAKYDQAGSVFATEPTGLVIDVTSYTE